MIYFTKTHLREVSRLSRYQECSLSRSLSLSHLHSSTFLWLGNKHMKLNLEESFPTSELLRFGGQIIFIVGDCSVCYRMLSILPRLWKPKASPDTARCPLGGWRRDHSHPLLKTTRLVGGVHNPQPTVTLSQLFISFWKCVLGYISSISMSQKWKIENHWACERDDCFQRKIIILLSGYFLT